MCYSEQMDKAAGYQEEHGYVLVGHKCVVNFGGVLMPWWWLSKIIGQISFQYVENIERAAALKSLTGIHPQDIMRNRHPMEALRMAMQATRGVTHQSFRPRELLVDSHGFHVVATEERARSSDANPFGWHTVSKIAGKLLDCTRFEEDPGGMARDLDIVRQKKINPPGDLCRVLVPESAVDDCGHCHAMVLIPPGERETATDIAICDQWNEQAKTWVGGPPRSESSLKATEVVV